MTTSNTTSLARKVTLALGAIVVSTVAVASASQAQAGVKVYLGWGGGHHWSHQGHGHGHWGPSCYYFKKKWHKTGKFYWKKKYFKCMGWW